MAQSHTIFRTKQIVQKELSSLPYIGTEHLTEVPTGWKYDIKRWGSPFDLKLPTLPRLSDPSTQGVLESEYFKSGVGNVELEDLLIQRIFETEENHKNIWAPVLRPGTYFRFKKEFYCYSDNSKIETIDRSANIDNRNYIELEKTPDINSPILASSFRRDTETGHITYKDKFSQMCRFSGTYDSSYVEKTTVSDLGRIYWENVDFTKKEFITDHTIDGLTRLFFNRDYQKTVGVAVSSFADLNACEQVGISNGIGHKVLFDSDLFVYVQIYPLKNFPILRDSSFHLYIADSSSYEEWTSVDTFWTLLNNAAKQYYVDKDLGYIIFASTNPASLPSQGYKIFVNYDLTLRIEYEVLDQTKEIVATDANVNPITQSVNQGFVCISHENLDPATITLSINKQIISGSSDPFLYGPITVGSDYAILKANVKSISGINLPNVQVFFTMEPSGLGFLNTGDISTSITNGEGNAFTNYQPPNNAEELGYYSYIVRNSTNPSYSGYREVVLHLEDTSLLGQEENLYTYLIQKDDLILGYKTVDAFLDSLDTPPWVVDSSTLELWKNEMTLKYNLIDFVEPTAYNKEIKGRKVVLYQINSSDNLDVSAINPVTGELGATVPVRPVLVEQISGLGDGTDGFIRVLYPPNSIPDVGSSEDIGGIWIVGSKNVIFQAYCWSDYYSNYIYSNKITAKISLPEYMLGEYINTINQRVPFGWKLPSDLDSVAAGLDGATFITINPYSGPHEILDLVSNTGSTEEWASAPFRSLNFHFKII